MLTVTFSLDIFSTLLCSVCNESVDNVSWTAGYMSQLMYCSGEALMQFADQITYLWALVRTEDTVAFPSTLRVSRTSCDVKDNLRARAILQIIQGLRSVIQGATYLHIQGL